jgi:hypothetical protein
VFFSHNLRLELRTLTDGPFAPVSGWRVCSHDGPINVRSRQLVPERPLLSAVHI